MINSHGNTSPLFETIWPLFDTSPLFETISGVPQFCQSLLRRLLNFFVKIIISVLKSISESGSKFIQETKFSFGRDHLGDWIIRRMHMHVSRPEGINDPRWSQCPARCVLLKKIALRTFSNMFDIFLSPCKENFSHTRGNGSASY